MFKRIWCWIGSHDYQYGYDKEWSCRTRKCARCRYTEGFLVCGMSGGQVKIWRAIRDE